MTRLYSLMCILQLVFHNDLDGVYRKEIKEQQRYKILKNRL